jgi:hypothetical protein
MTENQKAFLAAWRRRIEATYDWAKDAEKIERFMGSIERMLTTDRNCVDINSDTCRAAFREANGKGRLTYKALRTL